jgi:hypothetical protein
MPNYTILVRYIFPGSTFQGSIPKLSVLFIYLKENIPVLTDKAANSDFSPTFTSETFSTENVAKVWQLAGARTLGAVANGGGGGRHGLGAVGTCKA